MTEPKEPRAVYHPPEQEKPCCECTFRSPHLWCRHDPPPLELPRGDIVTSMGTCDYWEKRDD